jgi:hypothetical protein
VAHHKWSKPATAGAVNGLQDSKRADKRTEFNTTPRQYQVDQRRCLKRALARWRARRSTNTKTQITIPTGVVDAGELVRVLHALFNSARKTQ